MQYLAPDQTQRRARYQSRAENGGAYHCEGPRNHLNICIEIKEIEATRRSLESRTAHARFYWRNAERKWSNSWVAISLETFATRAEKEIPCE